MFVIEHAFVYACADDICVQVYICIYKCIYHTQHMYSHIFTYRYTFLHIRKILDMK